jgi:hypothetical protein
MIDWWIKLLPGCGCLVTQQGVGKCVRPDPRQLPSCLSPWSLFHFLTHVAHSRCVLHSRGSHSDPGREPSRAVPVGVVTPHPALIALGFFFSFSFGGTGV